MDHMRIVFSPVYGLASPVTVKVAGDFLELNGVSYDMALWVASNPEEELAPLPEFVVGPVLRVGSELQLGLMFPVGPESSDSARYPASVQLVEGLVEFPI